VQVSELRGDSRGDGASSDSDSRAVSWMISLRGSTKMRKGRKPRIDPWGTPEVTAWEQEEKPLQVSPSPPTPFQYS